MAKRTIEVFSAGCALCEEAIVAVKAASCSSCDVQVKDMTDPTVAAQANAYGINRVPAVVINGKLADCCASGTLDMKQLHSMGLGVA